MLQLATKADRAAINELARQIHELHSGWRPDLFCAAEELYPQERFDEHLKNRELYVAKIEGNVVGYALLVIRDFNHNGMYPCRVMVIDEFCVHEAARGHGIGTEMMADIRVLAKVDQEFLSHPTSALSTNVQQDSLLAFELTNRILSY